MYGVEWYAVQVASRKEKCVATAIGEKGYECFLPLYNARKVWSDRVKSTSVPLFTGYLFSRFDARFRLPILVTPGVLAIVGTGRTPTPVAECELEGIRAAIRNNCSLEPCDHLNEGDSVLVIKGPLAGVEGIFVRHCGHYRLILSVSLIQRSVAVELDRACVEPVRKRASMDARSFVREARTSASSLSLG